MSIKARRFPATIRPSYRTARMWPKRVESMEILWKRGPAPDSQPRACALRARLHALARSSLQEKDGDSPKLRQIRERAGNSAKAPRHDAAPPNTRRLRAFTGRRATRRTRKKAGRSSRPACVDTLSAVSLYAPAEVTNILGSHVERPGNMMTSTSTMNMEVRKYGM